jgi:hypothetical protein
MERRVIAKIEQHACGCFTCCRFSEKPFSYQNLPASMLE